MLETNELVQNFRVYWQTSCLAVTSNDRVGTDELA